MPTLTQTSIAYRRKASQIRELLERTDDEASQLKLIGRALEWIALAETEEEAAVRNVSTPTFVGLPPFGKRPADD